MNRRKLIAEGEELVLEAHAELLADGISDAEALDLIAKALSVVAAPALRGLIEMAKPNPDRLERRADKAEARGHHMVAARRRDRARRLREG